MAARSSLPGVFAATASRIISRTFVDFGAVARNVPQNRRIAASLTSGRPARSAVAATEAT